MAALFSNMDEAQKIRHQRDVLNQGIEDFLDGNYDNPRRVRRYADSSESTFI